MTFKVNKTPEQWLALLKDKNAEPMAYQITRQAATERAGTLRPLSRRHKGLKNLRQHNGARQQNLIRQQARKNKPESIGFYFKRLSMLLAAVKTFAPGLKWLL